MTLARGSNRPVADLQNAARRRPALDSIKDVGQSTFSLHGAVLCGYMPQLTVAESAADQIRKSNRDEK